MSRRQNDTRRRYIIIIIIITTTNIITIVHRVIYDNCYSKVRTAVPPTDTTYFDPEGYMGS